MFESIIKFFRKVKKSEEKPANSKSTAKERLHLVLMQDRANVSADFLELMKQEIIEVIKKYIDVDESAIDVRLTNKENEDGTNGAPALYANIPILNIKNETRKIDSKNENDKKEQKEEDKKVNEKVLEEKIEDVAEESKENANPDEKEEENSIDVTEENKDDKEEKEEPEEQENNEETADNK